MILDLEIEMTLGPPQHILEAVVDGDVDTVRAWLTSDARDLNESFPYGDRLSPDDDHPELFKARGTLLHAAVDPLAFTPDGDRRAMVNLLLANGADVEAVDESGLTPLHYSAHLGDLRMVAMLVERAGADINARDQDGCTPLLSAIFPDKSPDKFELVRFLVIHGAELFLQQPVSNSASPRLTPFLDVVANARAGKADHIADWLAKISAAGSWRRYLRAPRLELVSLRALCARGRAAPPAVKLRTISAESLIFERLFPVPPSKFKPAPRALPDEVFWHVLSFWRTNRDDESKSEEVVVDELRGRAPPGSFYAVTLRKPLQINIESFTFNTKSASGYALRVSRVPESIPLNVGDIICCIGSLEVFGRSLSEIGRELQTALSTPRIRLRLYRPSAGVDGAPAARACELACRTATPFFNLAHEVEQPAS